MTEVGAVNRLQQILRLYASARPSHVRGAVPTLGKGKPYELYCLADLLEKLAVTEGLYYQFIHRGSLQFRQKGGPCSASFAHLHAFQNGAYFGTIWTDVVFAGLSAHDRVCQQQQTTTFGQLHELDICMVNNDGDGIICHEEIMVGVECKDRPFTNGLLKEVLGVRREMSFVQRGRPPFYTGLSEPTLAEVHSYPPSWLFVRGSNSNIQRYATPGDYFAIRFEHV